eukprot:4820205-Pyramimonas_sp.AAC.1
MSRRRWRQFSGKHSRFHRRHGCKGSKYGGKSRGRGLLGKGFRFENVVSSTAKAAPMTSSASSSSFVGAAYQAGRKGM